MAGKTRCDATCIECGEGGFEPIKEERNGEEYHITVECDVCGAETVHLYNLNWFNSVTPKEYSDGNHIAGMYDEE